MLRVVLLLSVVMLTIYCVVEVAQSNSTHVRRAPRWLWAFLVIGLPVVGSLCWLLWGRPAATRPTNFPAAPDDDDDFLRGLG